MVTLGDFVFPSGMTAARVRTREVLSRVRKEIDLYSLLVGYDTLDALLGDLQEMEGQLELFDQREKELSIHEGRYYTGWRRDYRRFVSPKHKIASVHLNILTDDRFERSITLHEQTADIETSGQNVVVSQSGNGSAQGQFVITAVGTIIDPQLSDGSRSLLYEGTLAPEESLEFDSDQRTAVKNSSENVLHLVSGEFPLLQPGNTTLTYSDHTDSSHQCSLRIQYRDLWV